MFFNRARIWSKRLLSALSGRRSRPVRKSTVRLSCEGLEERLTPAMHIWTGLGADANWSTAGNWVNNDIHQVQAPNSSDDVLVFPANALRTSNVNDFGKGTTFQQVRLEGTGYTLGGNQLRVRDGIVTTLFSTGAVNFPIDVPGDSLAVAVSLGSNLTLGSVISGPGGVTKTGSGPLTLTGASTFQGDFDLFAGNVRLQNSSALGSTVGRTTVFGGAGQAVELTGGITVPEDFVLSNGTTIRGLTGPINSLSGTITSVGTGVFDVSSGGEVRVTGFLQGDGFLKTSPGELDLRSANGYIGTTTVQGGTLEIKDAKALGSPAGNTVVAFGATLAVTAVLDTPIAEPLSLSGEGQDGTGALRVISNNTVSAPITLNGASTIFVGTGITTTLNGVVSGGLFSALSKTGNGTLALAASNTYEGFTDIRAGELRVGPFSALGTSSVGTRVRAGATLEAVDIHIYSEPLFLNGAGSAGSGALRQVSGVSSWSGPVTLETATTMRVDSVSTMTLGGAVSGANGMTFTKTGTGRLGLAAFNTFAGQLQIQQGAVNISHAEALGNSGSGANTVVGAGAALEMSGSITVTDEFIVLAGSGVGGSGALRSTGGVNRIEGIGIGAAAVEFASTNVTIGVDSGELQMPVNFAEPDTGLTKIGGGKLALLANPDLSGTTLVAAGELQMTGNIGPVTVNNGGTLTGTGILQGNLTVNAGGTVSPGVYGVGDGVIQTITVNNGNVQFSPGSTFRVQLQKAGSINKTDQIRLTGSVARMVSLGNATLDLGDTLGPAVGEQFRIIDNQTGGTTIGQFNGLPQGGTITSFDGVPFRVNYFGGTGNDTVLTRISSAVPESPDEAAALAQALHQADDATERAVLDAMFAFEAMSRM